MKKGRRQGFKNADTKSRSPPVMPRQKKKSSFVMSVFGTGAMGNIRIRMIKTKLVSVVASKFTPYLDALTFSEFLKEKKLLARRLKLYKADTVNLKYLLNVMKSVKSMTRSSGLKGILLDAIMSCVGWESLGLILHQLLGKVCALM